MRLMRLPGWASALLALCVFTALLTSAARLNTSWLVPTGNIKVDYNVLARPNMKVCALTFDDGPDTKYTPAVAKVLDKYGIKATFFVVGHRVDSNPAELKALVKAGHEIGNHTQSHPDMSKLGASEQAAQISRVQQSIIKHGGVAPVWFRPPYGAFNKTTVQTASKSGMETVLWTVDPRDWAQPGAAKIRERVLSGTVPGAVILLHSTNNQTVEALPGIIEGLQKQGYSFLTMSEWHSAVTGGALPAAAPAPKPVEVEAMPILPPVIEHEPDALLGEAAAPPPVPVETRKPVHPSAASKQGAPRLLPPFERRDDVDESAQVPGPDDSSTDREEQIGTGAADEPRHQETSSAPPRTQSRGSAAPASSTALVTAANADGPEAAWRVWNSGTAGTWSSWGSSVEAAGGPEAYAASLGGMAYGTEQPEPAVEPAPLYPALPREQFDLHASGAWGAAVWQPLSQLTLEAVQTQEQAGRNYRYRPAPAFYLLSTGALDEPGIWDELAAYQRLARLDGMIVTGQQSLAGIPLSGPLPRTLGSAAALAADCVIEPALNQGAVRALDALVNHGNAIYIAIRPGSTSGFGGSVLGRGQRELLLLRRLIDGLEFDAAPEADLAEIWQLPSGVRMARFYNEQREVIALYCPTGECDELPLPEVSRAYRIATLNSANSLLLSPVEMDSLQLGGNALLLYREL